MKHSDFNPLPRKEGDVDVRAAEAGAKLISIHSLVKRETSGMPGHTPEIAISIHSLVKRETEDGKQYVLTVKEFQSTPS